MGSRAVLGFCLTAVLACALAAPAAAAPGWLDLGSGLTPGEGNGRFEHSPNVMELGGFPHVAWGCTLGGSAVACAARYDGKPFDEAPWKRLPGSPDSDGRGSVGDVSARVAQGKLHVAFTDVDFGNAQQLRVARFDDPGWSYVGMSGIGTPSPVNRDATKSAFYPDFAETAGAPTVAWQERAQHPCNCGEAEFVRVKRFNGSAWVELGSAHEGVGYGERPSLAEIGGQTYVAYEDGDTGGSGVEVTVKRHDPGTNTWIRVGSGTNAISDYGDPIFGSAQLDPSLAAVGSTPYVAFTQTTIDDPQGTRRLRVKRWNGSSWVQPVAGTSSLNHDHADHASHASIAAVGGQPHVAWLEHDGTNREVRASAFNGSAWSQLGGGSSPLNHSPVRHADGPDMGSAGGVPLVAWSEHEDEGATSTEVHVAAYGDVPNNTARPALGGTPQVGSQLTCSNGQWDGSYAYTKTWERAPRATTADDDPAWGAIDGASGDTYTVQELDAGSRVRCRVVASNGILAGEAVSTSKRTDRGPPRPVGAPTVHGSPIAGSEMTCDPGEWTNGPDFAYQWIQNGFPISGATGRTFRYPDSPSVDNNLLCRVTGTNDLGSWTGPTSNAVHVVGSTPRRGDFPAILFSGFFPNPVGARAECQGFAFTHDYGDYTYRWLRNGEEIPGATERVYTTAVDDLGRELQCAVTGHNPKGPGEELLSRNRILVPLPAGTVGGQMSRAGGRNEFDPVNFMATSDDFKAAIDPLVVERLQKAVEDEKGRCAAGGDVPVPRVEDFPDPLLPDPGKLDPGIRCALLVLNPDAIDIGPYGVQYRGAVSFRSGPNRRSTRTCMHPGRCPDLGFRLAPIDPANVRNVLQADLLERIAPVVPERVLWDVDNDGRTDVECPGEAPVMRSMLDKGTWKPRAVIVARDSAATGVYASVQTEFAHPLPSETKPGKQRRAQAFVCRTSIDPPPDPKQSPCITAGTIGRVNIKGNFCPVYLRALSPESLNNLPKDVYDVLKAMAEKLALAQRRKNFVYAPDVHGNPVSAAPFTGSDERKATATVMNTMSGTSGMDGPHIAADPQPRLAAEPLIRRIHEDVKALTVTQANFAFDEIYWAKDEVDVNGTKIVPNGDLPTLLVPTDAGNGIDSSAFNAMTINTPNAKTLLGDLELAVRGEVNARLEDAKSKATAVLREKLDLDALQRELQDKAKLLLGPFKMAGVDAKVKLENDGTATLTALAEIDILKDPVTKKGLRVELTLKGDKTGKLELQGVEFRAGTVLLGPVKVSDLFFRYDRGLTVRGKILIPPHDEGVEIGNFQLDERGGFKSLEMHYLAGAGSGILIGTGVYLTRLGGEFTLDRQNDLARFGLGTTVSVGPSTGGGCPTAGMDTDADLTIGGTPTFLITMHGQIKLLCIPLGNIDFRAGSDGLVTLKGRFHLDAKLLSIDAALDAFIKAGIERSPVLKAWQVGLNARVTTPDFFIFGRIGFDAEGVISNLGMAACGSYDPPWLPKVGAGAAIKFSNGRPPLTQAEVIANFRLFLGCDLSDYKPVVKRNFVRGAQAGTTAFTVPRDEVGVLLSIEGAGDAPRVKLRSPSGKEYDFTGASEGVNLPDAYGEILEQEDRTVVLIGKPEAGRWTAEPAEGSTAVNRVQIARILPPPAVKGSVSGKGASRVLSYSVARQAGQEVRFVEQAEDGQREIGTVRGGGKGTLRYTLAEAKGTARTVIAHVSQDGLPRTSVTVARYTAANPRVGTPKVKVRRSGSRALVSWSKADLAASYAVTVTKSDGSQTSYVPKRGARTLAIKGIGSKESATILVMATSDAGREGKPGQAKLAKVKTKRKKRRRR